MSMASPKRVTVPRGLGHIDPKDNEALARWNEQQLKDGLDRVDANRREMQAKGILDEHGNRVRKELPEEMLEGDKDCDIA
jgi:hypothetical protein